MSGYDPDDFPFRKGCITAVLWMIAVWLAMIIFARWILPSMF